MPRKPVPSKPETKVPTGGFRPEFLDFQRGIRVGLLEPHERITQILKNSLRRAFGEEFVVDRYGRGVYWQWICFLPKANRAAKPVSFDVNFGCSKFFIMVDREERLFKTGLQVERGFLEAPAGHLNWQLKEDWDWHRLVKAVASNGRFQKEVRRLVVREGFCLHAGSWEAPRHYDAGSLPAFETLRKDLESTSPVHWGGFQAYYPMTPEEVAHCTGSDLVESMLAIFFEVTAIMNACMQVPLRRRLSVD